MSSEIGSIVEGVVTGITDFGAFVELPNGTTGLVHISEVSDSFVEDVRQYLKEKDRIKVKILGKNDKGKLDLSIKQVNSPDGAVYVPRIRAKKGKALKDQEPSRDPSFEDKLSKFLKESEERLLDLKRNTESKRGRGRRS